MTEPSEWGALWRDLCEKDDRTSPEEYPDMVLLNFEEFCALLDAARRKGIEGAAEPSPWVAVISSLREPNPELEEAVAAAMMRVQSSRGWDDAPVPLRKIWCEAARQVIDALVDAALKEGMQNANPG